VSRDGFDRASIVMHSRPTRVAQRVTPTDLRPPSAMGKLRLLGLCLVGGVGLAILWVWLPLTIAVIVSPLADGLWVGITVATAALAFSATFFVLALREDEAARRYAREI
jgi:hypothetical protein